MDFASLMKSHIGAAKVADAGEKKYLKRSETEAQRQAKYWQEQENLEQERLDRLEKKRRRDEEEADRQARREEKRKKLAEKSKKIDEEQNEAEENARRKRLGLPPLVKAIEAGAVLQDGEVDISEEELLQKLRDLDEPRILFGETHVQRLRRFRKLMEKHLAPTLSKGPIPTTIQLVSEAEMKVPSTIPEGAEGRALLTRQLASYFDMILSEWSAALSNRPRDVKESFSGKQAHNSYLAARDNLIPLFKKLEAGDLSDELLKPILNIVDLAQQKRYVHANDAYLTLSIGKAAWPIGVTMVGIHERSARERLHESEKGGERAHILSDEVTRKMLQGIKRCLSFAQTRWPPDDIAQLMG